MEYDILESDDSDELIKKVKAAISDGWKPQGGVAVTTFEWTEEDGHIRHIEATLYQAMAKEA